MGTSAGCLLGKNGEQRLVVSDHRFAQQDTDFHPHFNANKIGVIDVDERFPTIDVALCKLLPGIGFTNSEYFDARAPKRLVGSFDVSDEGGWYEEQLALYPSCAPASHMSFQELPYQLISSLSSPGHTITWILERELAR